MEEKVSSIHICKKLTKTEKIQFINENSIKYDLQYGKDEDKINEVIINSSKNKIVFDKLISFARNIIYQRESKDSKYSFFIPIEGRVFDSKKKIPTAMVSRGMINDLIKNNPSDLKNNKSGYTIISEDEKKIKLLYQYLNVDFDIDWETLEIIELRKKRKIEIVYTNPNFFINETHPAYIAHIRKELETNLTTYLHPLGVYFCNNSTDLMKKFIEDILSNQDLLKNKEKHEITLKRVRLKFREDAKTEILLDKIEANGNNMLEHPRIKELINKGGEINKIECLVFYKDLEFTVDVASSNDLSYISVRKGRSSEIIKEDLDNLLEILYAEYFKILPDESRIPV